MCPGERLEASTRRLSFGEAAAFLLHQVILYSAAVFRRGKKRLPVDRALAKQHRVSLRCVRRPVLAVQRANSSGVGANPRDRVRTRVETSAHVELQHYGGLGVLG